MYPDKIINSMNNYFHIKRPFTMKPDEIMLLMNKIYIILCDNMLAIRYIYTQTYTQTYTCTHTHTHT